MAFTREEIWEVMVETIDELSLMTMGYPENRFRLDTDTYEDEGASASILPNFERWADRYTPYHNEMFQNVRT